MRVLSIYRGKTYLIVWRATASLEDAVAEGDAMKLELRQSFVWTPLLGTVLAADSGNKGKQKFSLFSLAGRNTGRVLIPCSCLQTSPLAASTPVYLLGYLHFGTLVLQGRFSMTKNFSQNLSVASKLLL